MAQAGDSYSIQLKPSHLAWGDYRNPTNRDIIQGEAYIPIHKKDAMKYSVYNSNHTQTGLGYNLFYASSADGFLNNVLLLAQGSTIGGDIYAKQFSVQGDLKMIGNWYKYCNASTHNSVLVTWNSPTTMLLKII